MALACTDPIAREGTVLVRDPSGVIQDIKPHRYLLWWETGIGKVSGYYCDRKERVRVNVGVRYGVWNGFWGRIWDGSYGGTWPLAWGIFFYPGGEGVYISWDCCRIIHDIAHDIAI